MNNLQIAKLSFESTANVTVIPAESTTTTGNTFFTSEKIQETTVSQNMTADIAVQTLASRAVWFVLLIFVIITIVISLLRLYFWAKKSPRLSTLWWVMWLVTIIVFFGGYFLYQYMMMKIIYNV